MKKGAFLVHLIYVLIIVAGSAMMSYRLLSYGGETQVPALTGLSLQEASALAGEKNLQVRSSASEYHATHPIGTVLSQNLPPGSKVKDGQVVDVVTSKGPKVARIPDFSGLGLEEARAAARNFGLELSRVSSTHHPGVPAGQVIAQNPQAGQSGTSVVRLLVSQGAPVVLLDAPNLVGMTPEAARAAAEQNGLKFVPQGAGEWVAVQFPAPGTPLGRGETVSALLGRETPAGADRPSEASPGDAPR